MTLPAGRIFDVANLAVVRLHRELADLKAFVAGRALDAQRAADDANGNVA